MSTEPDMSAAEYALGTLEGDERDAFLQRLAASEALQAEVERWHHYLTALEGDVAIAPDPDDWTAIAGRLGFDTKGTRTAREQAGAWIPFEPKVEIKFLQVDPITEARTALLRMEPDSVSAAHPHDQEEHCIVLDGEVTLDDHHLSKGDLHIAPSGTQHSAIYSKGGCLLLLRWEPRAAA